MASAYFYQMVTAHTAASCDQDHIDMLISSRATTPDRSAFIMKQSRNDPFAVMEHEARRLVAFGAEVLAVPCNTAHYFYTRLSEAVPVPVLNMVELTVRKAAAEGCRKLGILATTGTVHTDTYQLACKANGLDYAVPDADGQRAVMQVIYDGVKAGRPPDAARFNAVAAALFDAGCQALVLGCTELSLLRRDGGPDGRILDSMEVLAEAAILACGKRYLP
jgi:aspartate racemase